jgi:hypothetical protein
MEKDEQYLKALETFYKVVYFFTMGFPYSDVDAAGADNAANLKHKFSMHTRMYVQSRVGIYMNKLEQRLLLEVNKMYNDANLSSNVDTKNNEFNILLQYISEIIKQIDLILDITSYFKNLEKLKQNLQYASEIISSKLVKSDTLSRPGNTGPGNTGPGNTGDINVNTEMVPISAGGKKLLSHFTRKIKKRRVNKK